MGTCAGRESGDLEHQLEAMDIDVLALQATAHRWAFAQLAPYEEMIKAAEKKRRRLLGDYEKMQLRRPNDLLEDAEILKVL